jgi:hypothetical protein
MQSVNVKRSQAILRMPIEMVDAEIILHDGDRAEVLLFIAPSEDIAWHLTQGPQFMPVGRGGVVSFVARAAIASLAVPAARAPQLEEDLPALTQKVVVKLRSGVTLTGEVRWIGQTGQRIAEHLNTDTPYLVVYVEEATFIVVKTHIASVTES